ncbi:MAG TPA: DUF3455 domain-containing protein [Polyangiaceae bacterium]
MSRWSQCNLAWLVCAACQSKAPQIPPPVSVEPSTASAPPLASVDASPRPASDAPTLPPHLPTDFRIPENARLALAARGKGVQIYGCAGKKDAPGTFEWKLTAPDAELFDDHGMKVGKHFAGPTWESTDGSRVVGKVVHKQDAPDPEAIPWLMLASETSSGPGSGVFGVITQIARLDTKGGKAPAGGCDATHVGAEVRVPYEASYYFYSLPSGAPSK